MGVTTSKSSSESINNTTLKDNVNNNNNNNNSKNSTNNSNKINSSIKTNIKANSHTTSNLDNSVKHDKSKTNNNTHTHDNVVDRSRSRVTNKELITKRYVITSKKATMNKLKAIENFKNTTTEKRSKSIIADFSVNNDDAFQLRTTGDQRKTVFDFRREADNNNNNIMSTKHNKDDENANKSSTQAAATAQKEPSNKKRTALYTENLPTFYVGVGNNAELIIDIMKRLGWEQVFEKNEDTFKFKWVQSVRSINWNAFKEGEQIVNHVPNCSLFTNKLNLLCSLQAYEKSLAQVQNKPAHYIPLEEYVPLTYKLDDKNDRETFFATAKDDELWICKPTSLNQGKGIYLVREPELLKQKLEQFDEGQSKKFGLNKPINRIIQRYIQNPLTINKRKFDIRCYMLIASTKPLCVLFHHGYLRLSMFEFSNDDNNLVTHLTNQYFQKKDPKYKEIKEDTTWSMEQFNEYVNKYEAPRKNLPQDWVFNEFTKKMHQIMLNVVHGVRHKLKRKIGYFGLYGYDFMIDENMKTWLIEINVNPAITTNTDVLIAAIPPAVDEGIQIALECFEKAKQNKKLLPLAAAKGYQLLYNETSTPIPKPNLERSPSFARRSLSGSPTQLRQSQQLNSNGASTTLLPVTRQTITEISLINPRGGAQQNNTRQLAKSSDFRTKKINIDTQQLSTKGLDKINEESLNKMNKSGSEDHDTSTSSSKYKMRYSSAKTRGANASASANVVELKPATVEVFFRNTSSSKNDAAKLSAADKLERKPLATTVFPPPKIGLKS